MGERFRPSSVRFRGVLLVIRKACWSVQIADAMKLTQFVVPPEGSADETRERKFSHGQGMFRPTTAKIFARTL
jgi:hypothetical protein